MLSYLVIGLCIFLLFAVIYFSVKPISMGIEARRNIKNNVEDENFSGDIDVSEVENNNDKKVQISDEIIKLSKLKNEGVITEDEFKKAKNKLIN
tara:strand:+ start:188 stop:469 length:282 start_codon:yes stop_codon:yes gene_type:complete